MEQSPRFQRLPLPVFLVVDGAIAFLVACLVSERIRLTVVRVVPWLSRRRIGMLLATTLGAHLTESALAGRIASQKSLKRGPWVLQTLIVGFPSIWALSREKAALPAKKP